MKEFLYVLVVILASDLLPFKIALVENRGWALFDVGAYLVLNEDASKLTPLEMFLVKWERHIPNNVKLRLIKDVDKSSQIKSKISKEISCRSIL